MARVIMEADHDIMRLSSLCIAPVCTRQNRAFTLILGVFSWKWSGKNAYDPGLRPRSQPMQHRQAYPLCSERSLIAFYCSGCLPTCAAQVVFAAQGLCLSAKRSSATVSIIVFFVGYFEGWPVKILSASHRTMELGTTVVGTKQLPYTQPEWKIPG